MMGKREEGRGKSTALAFRTSGWRKQYSSLFPLLSSLNHEGGLMNRIIVLFTVAIAAAGNVSAQQPAATATPPTPTGISPGTSLGIPKFEPGGQGSRNIKVMSHIPLG